MNDRPLCAGWIEGRQFVEDTVDKYNWIDSDKDLVGFRKHIHARGIRILGMDFEAEFNLHHYGEKLCLIQVNDGHELHLIDALAVSEEEITKTLETTNIVKVFFDAASDAALVFRQYGAVLRSVLDLRILAEVLDSPVKNLGGLLEHYLEVEPEFSKKKLQMYDWTTRPLDQRAIEYALADVKYLLQLKSTLLERITENRLSGGLVEALVKNQIFPESKKSPTTAKRKKEYKALSRRERELYERLDLIRDGFARIENKPKDQILRNRDLIRLTKGELSVANCKSSHSLGSDARRILVRKIERAIGSRRDDSRRVSTRRPQGV